MHIISKNERGQTNEKKDQNTFNFKLDNFNKYFGDLTVNTNYLMKQTNPFPQHRTDRYLKQCFYNLQEKYDRCQRDFDRKTYEKLLTFICEEENIYERNKI